MDDPVLASGKLPPDLLRDLLEQAPPLPSEVALGPRLGEDACAISVPAGSLIAATDPITLTGEQVGGHAVVINANDVAVMGVRPRWFLAVVMLPEGTRERAVRALFADMRRALARIGAHLVGGHTEITAAVLQPVVVGQMLGLSESGQFVRTGGVSPGDRILQVGAAPIEAAVVLASAFPDTRAALGDTLWQQALAAAEEPGLSVVEAALSAAALGARALHDPTEGGLANGLHELAEASGVALQLAPEEALWFDPGRRICEALGADPWGALASGCLLAAFAPDRVDHALATLRDEGHPASLLAEAVPGDGVHCDDGRTLPRHARDEIARLLEVGP